MVTRLGHFLLEQARDLVIVFQFYPTSVDHLCCLFGSLFYAIYIFLSFFPLVIPFYALPEVHWLIFPGMFRYPHIEKDHLVKLLKRLIVDAGRTFDSIGGRSAPSAVDVPTLLGTGSFSLLACTYSKRSASVCAIEHWIKTSSLTSPEKIIFWEQFYHS